MGAAMGWLYSAADFVEQCAECYRWAGAAAGRAGCLRPARPRFVGPLQAQHAAAAVPARLQAGLDS